MDNYVYEKEKILKNINGTDDIYARYIKKRRDGCKGRIIILKNESGYNVKEFCKDDVLNHTSVMN